MEGRDEQTTFFAASLSNCDNEEELRDKYFDEVWAKIEQKESKMTASRKERLKEVLPKNKVFPVPGKEFATKSKFVHRIDLIPGAEPSKCYKYIRQSVDEKTATEKQVNKWLETGVIVPSKSP